MSNDKNKKTLTDADIITDRPQDRRGFLGLMAVSGIAVGAAATLVPGSAKAQSITDSDNGTWADVAGCGRGSGGYATGVSDADNGSLGTDAGGYGRGAPYC